MKILYLHVIPSKGTSVRSYERLQISFPGLEAPPEVILSESFQ